MKYRFYISIIICFASVTFSLSQQDYIADKNQKLMLAAFDNDTAMVLSLLMNGADVNAATWEGITSLMYAAQNGNTAIVDLLLANRANPSMRSLNGFTALISAIRSGYIETAEHLIRGGADVNQTDLNNNTPLLHAIAVDSFYLPDMLLYYDANVSVRNNNGNDALMLASKNGRYEVAFLLIENGADVNSRDESGFTPLHFASAAGKDDIMELLVLNGAIIDAKSDNGATPLILAVSEGHFSSTRLLVSYGADINVTINNTQTPLSIAMKKNDEKLTTMLVNNGATTFKYNFFQSFTLISDYNNLTLSADYLYNSTDSRIDFFLGLNDKKSDLVTALGFGFRPKAKQVLTMIDDELYYQYWEKRYFVSTYLDKLVYIPVNLHAVQLGVFGGLRGDLTFGSYRGSDNNPPLRFMISPRLGGFVSFGHLRLKVNYEYLNLHLRAFESGWVNFSIELMFENKQKKIRPPEIKGL